MSTATAIRMVAQPVPAADTSLNVWGDPEAAEIVRQSGLMVETDDPATDSCAL
jgi:inosine-uridine nucleoside N-ribohydrolase